jgi:hypothetical protein
LRLGGSNHDCEQDKRSSADKRDSMRDSVYLLCFFHFILLFSFGWYKFLLNSIFARSFLLSMLQLKKHPLLGSPGFAVVGPAAVPCTDPA